MGRLAGLTLAILLVSACGIGASSGSLAARSQSPSPSPAPASPVQTSQQPAASPSPTPAPSPLPEVTCSHASGAKNIVLLGSQYTPYSPSLIYEVTDPLHPRLLCRVLRTSAHLSGPNVVEYLDPQSATQTNIVLRFADGSEGPGGRLPVWTTSAAWLSNQGLVAYIVGVGPSATYPGGAVQVWVYEAGTSSLVLTYPFGIGDCVCRFGLPPPVLAVSPDGQYLVAGQLTGKGSQPLALYQLSDRTRILTLDPDNATAFWDHTDDKLFVAGGGPNVRMWTPAGGLTDLPGAVSWSFLPGLSPDGTKVAYTAYSDPWQMTQPRAYVYDLKTGTTRVFGEKLHTQVLFVKDGWVWYLEETACKQSCAGGTMPTGKVLAVQLATGLESPVVFAAGEDWQIQSQSPLSFSPGELWPAT